MVDIDRLHDANERLIGEHTPDVKRFFSAHYDNVRPAIYTSSDVRDAGFKAASVDANAFPAGFNNLCPRSREGAVKEVRRYFERHHPDIGRVLLLPEDHTRNPYYIENVRYLSTILDEAGVVHSIGSADPEVVYGVQGITTPSGETVDYSLVTRRNGELFVGGKKVDLVFSNNDFTTGRPDVLKGADVPVIPDPRLGWAHRTKAKHFALYNALATQLAETIGLDPWHLTVPTREIAAVDFKGREGLERVGEAAAAILQETQERYDTLGIDATPRVFVKDAAGTYGMGILSATTPEDITSLNNRGRQKMDKGKYGRKVHRVIVQEGVPTRDKIKEATAEPVVYMIRGRPIGAFYRYHPERDDGDNLNQPGMKFLPVCQHKGCHEDEKAEKVSVCLPNIEHLAAELAALALAYEGTEEVMAAADSSEVKVPAVKVA